MSILFGLKRSPGYPITEQKLFELGRATDRWATEGTSALTVGHVGMGFQPYSTHGRPHIETLPCVDSFGNVIAVDGRLDNHEELRRLLDIRGSEVPDAQIILAAFHRWKEACFSFLVGDWAIALWIEETEKLYLARDHAGSRTLYYERTRDAVSWSSHLETLVGGKGSQRLDSLFVNRYLALQPLEDATPYAGVQAVPAGHYLMVERDRVYTLPHWTPVEGGELALNNDREYEEQFLRLFRRAVERRIHGNVGILAQLSGGMDSTSIVCMADEIRRSEDRDSEFVDTVSFYDESEASWDDHNYFPIVEKVRGKRGCHIHTDGSRLSLSSPSPAYLFPGASGNSEQYEADFNQAVEIDRYRVILSGLGGDEFLGGVPYPAPELAGYLVRAQFVDFAKSGLSWALALGRPVLGLFRDTLTFMADAVPGRDVPYRVTLPWILQRGVAPLFRTSGRVPRRACSLMRNYYATLLASARENLPHLRPQAMSRLEYRYPMLDRDLLDFLVRIPRNQLLRPRDRRSLMKRALGTLLPFEVVNRRRKAVVSQGPLRAVVSGRSEIVALFKDSLLESLGFVHGKALISSLAEVAEGKDISFYPGIRRAIEMEIWLRAAASRGQIAI